MATFIALLRAVNVGGRKVEMAKLRKAAEEAGFTDVRTYIASGNLVLSGAGTAGQAADRLEAAIAEESGIEVPVIVRTAGQWQAYLTVPKAFAKAAEDEPSLVHLALAKAPPRKEAAKELAARAQDGERIAVAGDALWIHYPAGSGRSNLTPASISKAAGSPTTSRNVNTVRKLAEMAGVA